MKDIVKVLIIPLFLFVLLFGTSKLEVHAEEVEQTQHVSIWAKTNHKVNDKIVREFNVEFDYDGTMYGYVMNDTGAINLVIVGDNLGYHYIEGNGAHIQYDENGDFYTHNFVNIKYQFRDLSALKLGYSDEYNMSFMFEDNTTLGWNIVQMTGGADLNCLDYSIQGVKIFSSLDTLIKYIEENDDSGQINKPEVDINDTSLYDPSYYLIDFQANQSINAIWSGVSQRSYYTDTSVNEYINIYVGYAYNQAPGQIATVEKMPINYPISDKSLSILLHDIQHPDDSLHVKYVRFTPMYWSNTNNNGYYGESVYIYFDSNGNIDNMPNNPFDAEYDNSLPVIRNLSYNSLSPRDCHGTYTASGVTCFELSWDLPQSEDGDVIEFHLYSKYGYTTPWTTSEKFKTEMIDISNIGGTVFVDEGTHVFCSKEIGESLNIENMSAFDIHTIYKVYVRVLRLDENTKKYTCGNWSIFNIDKNGSFSLDINHSSVGSGVVVPGDITINDNGTFEGDVIEDIESTDKDNDNVLLGIDFSNLSTVFTSFASILRGLIGAIGHFPALFNSVFSMLPYELRMGFILLFYVSLIVGLIKIFK